MGWGPLEAKPVANSVVPVGSAAVGGIGVAEEPGFADGVAVGDCVAGGAGVPVAGGAGVLVAMGVGPEKLKAEPHRSWGTGLGVPDRKVVAPPPLSSTP